MYQLWLLTSIISGMVYNGYPDLRDEPLQALFFSFFHTHIHVLSSFWTSRGHRWSCLPPPRFLPSIFIAQRVQQSHCSSILSSSVANSRSRAFRKSNGAQEKVPTNVYEYALGGIRTHETDLYQARG